MSLDQTLRGIERAAKFGRFGEATRDITFGGVLILAPNTAILSYSEIDGAIANWLTSHGWGVGLVRTSYAYDGAAYIYITVAVNCSVTDLSSFAYSLSQTILGTYTFLTGHYFTDVQGLDVASIDQSCGNSGGNTGGGSGSGTYTVQAGNTLSGIAAMFGLTLSQIIALNPQISNPNVIQIGQVVNVAQGSNNNPTVNTNPITAPAVQHATSNTPLPPKNPAGQNWFDKTFFTGAGALSGVAIALLVVVGTGIVINRR